MGTLVIVGLGLIGGSCALAQRSYFNQIVAVDPDASHRDWALANHMVDGVYENLSQLPDALMRDTEVMLLCAPVAQIEKVFARVTETLPSLTLLMDVGSTKQNIIAAARANLRPTQYAQMVPAHPIAGREFSGPQAGQVDLFVGQNVILTPQVENTEAFLQRARDFWKHCGARVHDLDATLHDQVFAAVSHLPHLIAYALMECVAQNPNAAVLLNYAGASLRDTSRVASSSPVMWRDIALANRSALLSELTRFQDVLSQMVEALKASDDTALHTFFTHAKNTRDGWLQNIVTHGDSNTPPPVQND